MGRLVLILGGARSGKSSIAERMAREGGGRVTYIATAEAYDDEMRARIAAHQAARPAGWQTIEEPLDLAGAVDRAAGESNTILVDCLTLWVSNQLCRLDLAEGGEGIQDPSALLPLLRETAASLSRVARDRPVTLLLVSNEVGLGLVPDNPLGRAYRDLLGFLNQRLAAEADQLLLMVAGIPVDVKRLSAAVELGAPSALDSESRVGEA